MRVKVQHLRCQGLQKAALSHCIGGLVDIAVLSRVQGPPARPSSISQAMQNFSALDRRLASRSLLCVHEKRLWNISCMLIIIKQCWLLIAWSSALPLNLCNRYEYTCTLRLWTGHKSCLSSFAACCWWCVPHDDRASIHRHLSQFPCSSLTLHDKHLISHTSELVHGRMEEPASVCLS